MLFAGDFGLMRLRLLPMTLGETDMRKSVSSDVVFCRFLFPGIFILAVCLIPSCGGWEPVPEKQLPRAMQKKLQIALDGIVAKYSIPGVIAGVWYPDVGEWIKVAGVSNTNPQMLMNATNRFRIGGLTKPFTATVVLQLVDEGKITLDQTLKSFRLGFVVPGEDMITVRQLLNHTSGLFNYADDEEFIQSSLNDPARKWTPAELVRIAVDHGPYFQPGGGFRLSDTNYVLLGLIVQKVTKRTIGYEIDRRVVMPLKLKYTFLPSTPITTAHYSRGYIEADDGTLVDVTALDPSGAWAAGGMVSYLNDLELWAPAFATGELITAETFAKQTSFNGQSDFQYGLGIMRIWGFLGHDGEVDGYNTAMFHLPEKKATIIVLMNKSSGTSAALELFQAMAKIVFPEQFPAEEIQ
jgi:D-alanyl-D-alanine carboxypeptidase